MYLQVRGLAKTVLSKVNKSGDRRRVMGEEEKDVQWGVGDKMKNKRKLQHTSKRSWGN